MKTTSIKDGLGVVVLAGGLGLAGALGGCKSSSRAEMNRASAIDGRNAPTFAEVSDRETLADDGPPVLDSGFTTVAGESDLYVVEEPAPTVLSVEQPTPSPLVRFVEPSGGSGASSGATTGGGSAATRRHTIAAGDTLSEISEQYYGTARRWQEIAAANPGVDPNRLIVGNTLVIPGGAAASSGSRGSAARGGGRVHVVAAGDTLSEISQQYYGTATRWQEIAAANPGVDPNRMSVGAELVIP
ncbi:MAG: LysM domain-containing protein [Planctomycetota bacterium]